MPTPRNALTARAPGAKRPLRALVTGRDVTTLTPEEERAFQHWVAVNNITDLDHPNSHYDYRGWWKQSGGAPVEPGMFVSHMPGEVSRASDAGQLPRRAHFTDQFKQHGHETFSQESQYSRGPWEGGMWIGEPKETFLAQPPMAVAHLPLGGVK